MVFHSPVAQQVEHSAVNEPKQRHKDPPPPILPLAGEAIGLLAALDPLPGDHFQCFTGNTRPFDPDLGSQIFSHWANWQVTWFGTRTISVRVGGARPDREDEAQVFPLPPESKRQLKTGFASRPHCAGETPRHRLSGGSRMSDDGHAQACPHH